MAQSQRHRPRGGRSSGEGEGRMTDCEGKGVSFLFKNLLTYIDCTN